MNNQFSENLKKIRKENNLSQEQLADELGVSRQAISKWESAQAYPEMDKIIALCNKFDLNIDDLLNKDIKEVKGEEESKKKLNNYIDDFLKYISDSINLFVNMTFKCKIKCILEQILVIFILFILSSIILSLGNRLFSIVFSLFPVIVSRYLLDIINSILSIVCIIGSLVIWSQVFKTRYLNYYVEVKKEKTEEKDNNEKVNKNENKIIIRDPNHSDYKFINGLFKIFIIFVKIFLAWIALSIAFGLVCLFIGLIISFMLYKTGIFFIGLLLSILSSACMAIIILLLILNFIFNRKSNIKRMIISFIGSLIVLGAGCGLIISGTVNFDVVAPNDNMYKSVKYEYDMRDDFRINNHYNTNIEYKEEERDNIKVEYYLLKYFDVDSHMNDNTLYYYSYSDNPMKIVREVIKNANNKKLIPFDSNIQKITVYASSSNIEKIKNNIDQNNLEKGYEENVEDIINDN